MSLLSAILVIVSAFKNRNPKLILPWVILCSLEIVLGFKALFPFIKAEFGILLIRICLLGTYIVLKHTTATMLLLI